MVVKVRDMDGLVNHNVIYLAGQRVIIRKCTTNGGIGFSAKGGVISFDNNKQMSEAKPETLVALIPVFLPPLGPVPHSFPGFLSCQCLAFSAAENLAYTDFFGVVLVLNSSDLVDVSLRNKPPLSELGVTPTATTAAGPASASTTTARDGAEVSSLKDSGFRFLAGLEVTYSCIMLSKSRSCKRLTKMAFRAASRVGSLIPSSK